MALWILLAFIGVPLIEIALFIQVGGFIGLWPTIGIVIATALAGTALIRRQGLNTLQRAQAEMDAQRLPVRELFDGICLIFAGAMLLTPGFLTDTVGFILLIPPLRALLGRYVWRALQNAKGVRFEMPGGQPYRDDDGPIVDADAVEIKGEIDEERPPPR
ncbi:MAG: FxsA family protein [Alphaproteobacteria bacterium]|nr:FxsA family protein [Alphaproteobacteria bacterium]